MNSEDAYAIWAPIGSPWSPWVKPIVFAQVPDWDGGLDPELPFVTPPDWLDRQTWRGGGYRTTQRAPAATDDRTAFVVDLPGAESVAWGMLLAERGWRPVPLYNALPGPEVVPPIAPTMGHPPIGIEGEPSSMLVHDTSPLVDVWAVVRALRRATPALEALRIGPERPPVFLLDADRRLGRGLASPGRFDNRSISLVTDFPSAVFLRARGIERVVLVHRESTAPQEDLAHTLVGWQQGGLAILAPTGSGPAVAITVEKPTWFRSMFQRFLATMGLRRSPLGGFGGTIPIPSSG